MTDEELWGTFGGGATKAEEIVPWQGWSSPGAIGNTVNLPQQWQEWENSLWETLTFQPNINIPRFSSGVGLSIAILCADVKARDVANCEMVLWKRDGTTWRYVNGREHPFARMLALQPNEVQSWTDFWRMTLLHLGIAEQAFVVKRYDRRGSLLELLPVAPARVRVLATKTGRIYYEIANRNEFEAGQMGTDETIRVSADYMIHIRGRQSNGITGLSAAALGDPIFNLSRAISDYQTTLFSGQGKTPMVFEMEGTFGNTELSDAAFRRLKEQLTKRQQRMDQTGEPIVLEAGMKAKQIAANARDSMTSEAWNSVVMRICGLMQTPPHKIFHYESVKYDNQAAADAQYANSCLIPMAKNVEQKFNLGILDREREFFDYSVEFDRGPMLAGDPKILADILDQAIKNGGIEVDEYRERLPLNLNPLPNRAGEIRYVPVNMAMVDRDGNVIQQVADGQNNNTGEQTGQPPGQPGAQPAEATRDLVRVVEKSLEALKQRPEAPSMTTFADAFAQALSKALPEALKAAPAPVVNVHVPPQPKVVEEILDVLERDEKGGISKTRKTQVYG